ncbi:helix-turn-helix transcriptional regulator [Phyllobacterium phragmitis]|uniref:Helix-turn-helix transcriptional regulator n=1 Tax=Phyllobacterium phragmitis TaxID=2670329 RepID=A0A2S9IKD2_9HYPH|nr:response regulator transcription factor [Phyllobacterium phragmitis]PRD40990.1 helix-turn-helix transcriptional regulator [Phyllobacterium phragmitis]
METILRNTETNIPVFRHKSILSGTPKHNEIRDEADADIAEAALFVIDSRTLDRECIAQSLRSHNIGMPVVAIGSFEQWLAQRQDQPATAILINIGGQKVSDPNMTSHLRRVVSECGSVPVVILADKEDMSQILKALECGVHGYIPTSVGIDVCVEAIRLAMAGGTFVPASSVLAMRHAAETGTQETRPMGGMFTQRQAEVVKALRRGKANKIIAYELNLRESTVKVHIRNIMKKLKATNRTEVAYMINDLFPSESSFADAD